MVNARHLACWDMGLLHFDLLFRVHHVVFPTTSCDEGMFGNFLFDLHSRKLVLHMITWETES